MPKFQCKTTKVVNGFDIVLYEVDMSNLSEQKKLENYIKQKIKKMKAHNSTEYMAEYLNNPNIDPEFAEKLVNRIREINTPTTHSMPWFDVRRSRVTEFMSQLLLEREYGCIFYDEADKRINTEPVNIDKHTPGIDVTGVLKEKDTFKFVACEVKASKESNIPCSSSNSLLTDIKNGYNNKEERLSKEILEYTSYLCKMSVGDELLSRIIEFLIALIRESSAQVVLLRNVIFFPFMIRNNEEIVNKLNLDDFRDFKESELSGINLKGIIWSFNNDIDSFCNNIYDEVLVNA